MNRTIRDLRTALVPLDMTAPPQTYTEYVPTPQPDGSTQLVAHEREYQGWEVGPMPPLATPPDTRPALTARPVCCEADALLMGEIRHTQRAGFSQDNTPIDAERQRDWWHAWRNRINAWLYYDRERLVAYGCLIQRNDGTWVSSCAVLPEFEGRRFGKTILHHLITSVDHEVYAQARTDNPAAVHLHNPLDWETVDQTHHLVFFRTRAKVRTAHSLNAEDYR